MTEPSVPDLTEVAALLAHAWSRRSPGEQAAFADRLASASAPQSLPEDGLRTVRERAALSGALAPSDLVRGFARDQAAQILDLLAPEFDRMQLAGRWAWMLRAGPRQATLARLVASGQLAAALDRVVALPTDPAGEALRALAATGTVAPADRATTVQALAWAQPLGGLAGDLAEAQRQAAVEALGASYDGLVQHGVFGRKNALDQLRAFAGEEADPAAPVPLLPVTGIGGAGKSTVLGSFIRPYLDRIAASDPVVPAVVVIDFDRLLFRPDAELELSFELTRQLGLAAPAAGADFSALRYQVRSEQRQTASDTYDSTSRGESSAREASGFEEEAGQLVRMHELARRTVLLVLDTFEEWQREQPDPEPDDKAGGDGPEPRILDWVGRVRGEMGLAGLRVVVSGRTGIASAMARPPLELGDLPEYAATTLLQAMGVGERDTRPLARLVGGNPLTLHVAARFYLELPTGAQRSFLAGDPLAATALTDDIRRAVLYDRFLGHIADERVRKLAHPGLVLRRVTPDLIQHVLGEPCGLGEIDRATAEQLTDRLADEVWLVRKAADGLRHRPDVRAPMIRLMSDDPEYAEVTRQIHAAAVRWYRDRRDPVLPSESADLEAFYHRLMLETGDDPVFSDPPARKDVRDAHRLGRAVDELPPKVAIQVRVVGGDRIPDSGALSLPDPLWQQWASRRGFDLVKQGQARAALSLFEGRQAVRPVQAEPEWLAQAYSDAARWEEYWPIARRFAALPADAPAARLESGRYAMLNALMSPDQRDLASYEDTLSGYLVEAFRESRSAVTERLFFHLLCSAGVAAGPLRLAPARTWRPPGEALAMLPTSARSGREQGLTDLYPVDELRRVMVWIAGRTSDEPFVLQRLAALCRPDPAWMRDFARFVGRYDNELDSRINQLERTATRTTSSHELLGEWALSYTRTLGDQLTLSRSQARRARGLIGVLRGDNPELRPAIQLALADVITGPEEMKILGAIAHSLLPVQPANLVPRALGRQSQRVLVQLVEYVDRSGVMGRFLTAAGREWPRPGPLRIVSEAFGRWDEANRRLLDWLGGQLDSAPGG